MDNKKLLASPAYQMFIEELDKHLASATKVLTDSVSTQPLSPSDRTKLSTSFHTIRGSAGFFSLSEVASTAKQLEELLGAQAKPDDCVVVRDLVEKMIQITSSLPRPV